jgi:NitT/TauT family transport system ATP-binding protein
VIAADPPLVALKGVGKTFSNGTIALAGLNLDVRAGEFLSLLGPSGCGKSTALRMIAGLAEASTGSISRPVSGEGLGFVFQEPTLMPWATVADNVWLPLRLKGVSKADAAARIEDVLHLVGLDKFKTSYPRELSGGMKMRVSIARALVMSPKLLLMDEPFAALDEITRSKLNDDLLRIKVERGCTVIFVTHSVYESVYLSSRIVVMAARPGRVIAEIAVDEPMPRPESFRRSPTYIEACRRASEALLGALGSQDHL